MRTFTISGSVHKGKQITVVKYQKHSSGLQIEIKHDVATSAGKQLRWVQTLKSNHPEIIKCKLAPGVVDPFGSWDPGLHKVSIPGVTSVCKADDTLPFYFTDAEFTTVEPNLTDRPSSPTPASGRYWWQFITALTEVTGKTVHHLVAIAWGYDHMADGSVRAAAVRIPTTEQMKDHGQALKKMYSSYRFN